MKNESRKAVRKMRYEKIKEVKEIQVKASQNETPNVTKVNELLSQGWILLEIFTPSESDIVFILGRCD